MYFSDKRPGCRQKTGWSIRNIPKEKNGDPWNTECEMVLYGVFRIDGDQDLV